MTPRIKQRLAVIKGLSFTYWSDLARSAIALFHARVIFSRLSSQELISELKSDNAAEAPLRAHDAEYLQRLEWSLSTAANHLPWRTDCLIRCLAAKRILGRRGLPSEFHLGVKNDLQNGFGAHAWITCGGQSVAGGNGEGFHSLIGGSASTA